MSSVRELTLGEQMHALATELFPFPRCLAGPGVRDTLEVLERVTGPMQRHTFATGERVHDWTIPREWVIRDAWIRDPEGREIVSFEDSNLHVVSHSRGVHERISLAELQEHLFSLPELPDAIPYRTTYYRDWWGFCMSERQRATLADGEYEVMIDAELVPGELLVGEIVIAGTGPSEVLLSTYVCHPSMANNELSGPVVASQLVRTLQRWPADLRHTYRILFLPETIGSIAYLARFGERLRERLAAGYVVTCVGAPVAFNYHRSRRGDTLADRAARVVLAHCGLDYEENDFYPAGSDERQYCSPGYDLPVGLLMRASPATFPQYHSSLDDLELVTAQALQESYDVYHQIICGLEANERFEVTVSHCEPYLSGRGLYPTTGAARVVEQERADMMFLLNYLDGRPDLLTAAERIGRPIGALRAIVDRLVEHDLLRRVGPGDGERG